MADIQITYRKLTDLKSYPKNSRTHSRRQIEKIAESIKAFGFNEPIGIDSDGVIVFGHGRAAAAELSGMDEVPTVNIDHLSDEQKRAYRIASNRLAELAGWDDDLLALELGDLAELDLDFDLTALGFETAELDLIIGDAGPAPQPDPADDISDLETGPRVSQPDDLWLIGQHRLLCGDATQASSYEALMAGERAQMIISDVPYNLRITNNVSGLGKIKHGEFLMASGEMSQAEFTRFLTTVFRLMVAHSVDGSIHFIFIDWRHLLELLRAGRIAYTELKNMVVWVKRSGGMGAMYRSQHEHIAVFKSGTAPHINNVELGRFGRNRTNVWHCAGMNSFGPEREELLALHATVKPVSLIADAILDCSHRGGIILDPFLGSGTAILAAERSGRRCYAMELDPRFVDVALRRVRKSCGIEPVHAGSRIAQLVCHA